MKPKLFILQALIIINFSAFSQTSSDKISYKANAIYMSVIDENNKEVSNVPMGKSTIITIDTFFKSYYIMFLMESGFGDLKLSYLQKQSDGSIKMVDKDHIIYYVNDKLATNGILKILRDKKVSGLYSYFIVENATKTKLDQE